MTLQELAQILGSIGVIASMIYVGIQIRNNARAVRAAAFQQLSTTTSSIWSNLAQNGELCSILKRGFNDLSSLDPFEKHRLMFQVMAYMRHYENAWFQHKIGTLKEDEWRAIAADLHSAYASPGARALWPEIKNRSNAGFRSYVDTVVEQQAAAAAAASPPEGIESGIGTLSRDELPQSAREQHARNQNAV